MSAPVLNPEMLCQVGFVVHDVEATARKYAEAFGFPVPTIIETPGYDKAKTIVEGQPSEATTKLAFFQTGQLVVELIEPDKTPSVWRDYLDSTARASTTSPSASRTPRPPRRRSPPRACRRCSRASSSTAVACTPTSTAPPSSASWSSSSKTSRTNNRR